jgi:hypothetical protein
MGRFATITYFPQAVGIFLRKSWKEKWTLITIIVLSFFVRMMVLLFPFKYLAKFLGDQNKATDSGQKLCFVPNVVHNISRQIKNVSSIVPWDFNCLVQAAVGKIILRRKKIASTIHFGVKKEDNSMKAHAWLKVGSEILLGGEIVDQYTEVSSFS